MVLKTILLLLNILVAVVKSIFRKFVSPAKKSVKGEIVLITGAGHGMGRLYSLRFAELGAKVIAVDVNENANLQTASMVKEFGATVYSYTCDLRSKESIKKLGKTVKKDVGDVDILVNNAGVIFNTSFFSLTEEMISTTFDVNIMSHFWLIREFLPAMKRKNHGHILAMASYSGKEAMAYFVDYSSSKCAVIGLMDALRRELRWEGLTGIKTTYANPMFVNTGFVKNPRSSSHLLCPVLEPQHVVDQVMDAFLTDQPVIDIPSLGLFSSLMQGLLPQEASELIIDYVKPMTDHLKVKKIN